MRAWEPRVLQVVLSLDPGGTERLVVELSSRLNPEIPMMVVCLDEEGTWARDLRARGIGVIALQRGRGFRPALGGAIAAAVSRHRATIIHAHHYSPFVYGALARLWRPAPQLIFTEHGRLSDALPSTKRRTANWFLAKAPTKVFAVSEDLKRHLVAEGFAAKSVDVIYNGIDVGPLPDAALRTHVRRVLGIADDEILIGTVARLDPVKGLDTLIQAMSTVGSLLPPHEQSSLRASLAAVIIGDGSERPRLESQVAALGLPSSVRFLGHCDDARKYLAGCDVYVNSSISEGVSLTILEAMAAGLPVVATRVGGTPEVLDASCGRLIPSRDPGALAAALVDLALQPDLRRQLGQAARTRVETLFPIDRMIRQYRDVYSGLGPAPHSAVAQSDRRKPGTRSLGSIEVQ